MKPLHLRFDFWKCSRNAMPIVKRRTAAPSGRLKKKPLRVKKFEKVQSGWRWSRRLDLGGAHQKLRTLSNGAHGAIMSVEILIFVIA